MEELGKSWGILIAWIVIYLVEKLVKNRQEKKARDIAAKEKAEQDEKDKMLAKASGVENNNEIDRQVKHQLTKFLIKFRPIRTFVIHFHNGTFTDAGVSIQKITILHEKTLDRHVPYLSKAHDGLITPEFLSFTLSKISFAGKQFIRDRAKVKEKNLELYEWLRHWETEAMYSTEIRSHKKNKIVAILCLQFDKINPEIDFTFIEEEKKRIEAIYDDLP